jgi:hypothetical protein
MYQLPFLSIFSYCPIATATAPARKIWAGGYLAIPRKEYAVCRTVYMESDNKDFDSDHFSAAMMSRLAAKSGPRTCSDLQ